jgi:DNA helicase-2/ATP-dependent DNA helicase PcrA
MPVHYLSFSGPFSSVFPTLVPADAGGRTADFLADLTRRDDSRSGQHLQGFFVDRYGWLLGRTWRAEVVPDPEHGDTLRVLRAELVTAAGANLGPHTAFFTATVEFRSQRYRPPGAPLPPALLRAIAQPSTRAAAVGIDAKARATSPKALPAVSASPPFESRSAAVVAEPTARPAERAIAVTPAVGEPELKAIAERLGCSMPRHSLVFDCRRSTLDGGDAGALLRAGIKLHIAYDPGSEPPWFDELAPFASSEVGLLNCHVASSNVAQFLPVVDGARFEEQAAAFAALEQSDPSTRGRGTLFNFGQYAAEHTSSNDHIHVTAGAGTGKTWLLVQRVLFLLHTGVVRSPSQLALVTFTREAAAQLRQRLTAALATRARLTGRRAYLDWLFSASDMNVSTIHAFAKQLLQNNGQTVGISPRTTVANLARERERIVHECLAPHVEEKNFTKLAGQRLHEFVGAFLGAWEQADNLGIPLDRLDWGKAPTDRTERWIQSTLSEALPRAAARFEELKATQRTMTVNDFGRKLKAALVGLKRLQLPTPLTHLFIDEFQDTDNVQIDIVATIVRLTAAKVFVVGDVKQSIYRFRGAQTTAFTELADRMRRDEAEPPVQLTLRHNYRSAPAILSAIAPMFARWGERGWIPYDAKKDALMPTVSSSNRDSYQVKAPTTLDGDFVKLLKDLSARDTEAPRSKPGAKDTKAPRIAVLVRTNREGRELHELCRSSGVRSKLSTGGTLFASRAATDLAGLVRALLHPRDPITLAAFCQTAYATQAPALDQLLASDGDRDRLLTLYERLGSVAALQKLASRLHAEPLLAVLYRAIEELRPSLTHASEPEGDAPQYERNLDRILSLIHEQFSHDALSAYALLRWLDLQRSTNRDDDEPLLEESTHGDTILIKTVHRAKGLEYDTVVVRASTRAFVFENAPYQFRIQYDENEHHPIGWSFQRAAPAQQPQMPPPLHNEEFSRLAPVEYEEARRDEARLLYVALTRAKRRLIVCLENEPRPTTEPENWCQLVRAQ